MRDKWAKKRMRRRQRKRRKMKKWSSNPFAPPLITGGWTAASSQPKTSSYARLGHH